MTTLKVNFEHLLRTRQLMLGILEKAEDKAYIIPEGFNNSLYWNAAHCAVTVQLLCYKLTGNAMYLEDEVIDAYRKGTKATGEKPNAIEIGKIKDFLITSIEQLEKDYNEGLLNNFAPYETSFGVKLNSIEDTLKFMNTHEALHLGYMMALRKHL